GSTTSNKFWNMASPQQLSSVGSIPVPKDVSMMNKHSHFYLYSQDGGGFPGMCKEEECQGGPDEDEAEDSPNNRVQPSVNSSLEIEEDEETNQEGSSGVPAWTSKNLETKLFLPAAAPSTKKREQRSASTMRHTKMRIL
ncbi:hypothetical protein A6R68_13387, partial [Neotoma lepida]